MRDSGIIACALVAIIGCGASSQEGPSTSSETSPRESANENAEPASTQGAEVGSQLFGAELQSDLPTIPLAQVLASPQQYVGQVIKTEGQISQVCQRMGCWMELRDEASGESCRVPMAGHSFFLPRDVAGRTATIQGQLSLTELSADHRQHLEEEGAQAAGGRVQIDATGVLVH